MTDYRPVSCAMHSEFELAIMRKRTIRLEWRNETGWQQATVLPVDLETRNGEEFLWFEHGGQKVRVRLDRIRRIDEGGD